MGWFILDLMFFLAGYVASIYTWPTIRGLLMGAQSEIAQLEAKLAALKAAVKS